MIKATKPRGGQTWVRIQIDKRGVHSVRKRRIILVRQDIVTYTPKRITCQITLAQWRKWARKAHTCRS